MDWTPLEATISSLVKYKAGAKESRVKDLVVLRLTGA